MDTTAGLRRLLLVVVSGLDHVHHVHEGRLDVTTRSPNALDV